MSGQSSMLPRPKAPSRPATGQAFSHTSMYPECQCRKKQLYDFSFRYTGRVWVVPGEGLARVTDDVPRITDTQVPTYVQTAAHPRCDSPASMFASRLAAETESGAAHEHGASRLSSLVGREDAADLSSLGRPGSHICKTQQHMHQTLHLTAEHWIRSPSTVLLCTTHDYHTHAKPAWRITCVGYKVCATPS
jgi:hypothetical protein